MDEGRLVSWKCDALNSHLRSLTCLTSSPVVWAHERKSFFKSRAFTVKHYKFYLHPTNQGWGRDLESSHREWMLLPWKDSHWPLNQRHFPYQWHCLHHWVPKPRLLHTGSRGNQNPGRILRLPISTREMHSFLHWKTGPAHASPLIEGKPSVFIN